MTAHKPVTIVSAAFLSVATADTFHYVGFLCCHPPLLSGPKAVVLKRTVLNENVQQQQRDALWAAMSLCVGCGTKLPNFEA